MTPSQAESAVGYVAALFPTVGKFWSPERRTLLAESIERVNITMEQAQAVINEMRRSLKGPLVEANLLGHLKACEPVETFTERRAAVEAAPLLPPHGYSINEWPRLVRDVAAGVCRWSMPALTAAADEFKRTGVVPKMSAALGFGIPREDAERERYRAEVNKKRDPFESEIDSRIGAKGSYLGEVRKT